jgi:DNA-binding winged helix-turn-helix (wHTH) protein
MLCRFGDFTIDIDTRRLRRLGQDVHLTPKAFDLLNLLIDNRDRAVSKAELQQKIWPSTFVEETNLASLIAEIRRALSGSDWIRTVYGFGYQFVGTASREAQPFEHDSARPPPRFSSTRPEYRATTRATSARRARRRSKMWEVRTEHN